MNYDKRAVELDPGGAPGLLDVLIRAGLIFRAGSALLSDLFAVPHADGMGADSGRCVSDGNSVDVNGLCFHLARGATMTE